MPKIMSHRVKGLRLDEKDSESDAEESRGSTSVVPQVGFIIEYLAPAGASCFWNEDAGSQA